MDVNLTLYGRVSLCVYIRVLCTHPHQACFDYRKSAAGHLFFFLFNCLTAMLPYGTLWKLDQMLHPVGPPQRRTVAMRRRQALFFFVWVCSW